LCSSHRGISLINFFGLARTLLHRLVILHAPTYKLTKPGCTTKTRSPWPTLLGFRSW